MTRDLIGWFCFLINPAVAWWCWPNESTAANVFIAGWLFDGRLECLQRWWEEYRAGGVKWQTTLSVCRH